MLFQLIFYKYYLFWLIFKASQYFNHNLVNIIKIWLFYTKIQNEYDQLLELNLKIIKNLHKDLILCSFVLYLRIILILKISYFLHNLNHFYKIILIL